MLSTSGGHRHRLLRSLGHPHINFSTYSTGIAQLFLKCKSDPVTSFPKSYLWFSMGSYNTPKLIFEASYFHPTLLPCNPHQECSLFSPTSRSSHLLAPFLNPLITLPPVAPRQLLLVLMVSALMSPPPGSHPLLFHGGEGVHHVSSHNASGLPHPWVCNTVL